MVGSILGTGRNCPVEEAQRGECSQQINKKKLVNWGIHYAKSAYMYNICYVPR